MNKKFLKDYFINSIYGCDERMISFSATFYQKLLIGLLFITMPFILFGISETEGIDNKRLLIGIDLFPSFLASDKNIQHKVGDDHHLHIVIAYQYEEQIANDMAQRLESLKKIRGISIKVVIYSVQDFDKLEYIEDQTIAGLFIAESMIPLNQIIKLSIKKQFIVFSPFQGDVEKGVAGGIYITEKILPYINMKTLREANIKMKSFFLRVSKKYE